MTRPISSLFENKNNQWLLKRWLMGPAKQIWLLEVLLYQLAEQDTLRLKPVHKNCRLYHMKKPNRNKFFHKLGSNQVSLFPYHHKPKLLLSDLMEKIMWI